MSEERQRELLKWLERMEEFAAEERVKTRLLDAMEDCRKALERELTEQEQQEIIRKLEELFRQVKSQTDFDEETDSLETEVRQKAAEMMERCRRSNEALQKDYLNGTAAYIQEAERSMRELCNGTANYEEIMNKERFLNIFIGIGQKFRQQADDIQREYINAGSQNYQNVFDQLKTLFSSTGYDREAQQKFYKTYYENQDTFIRNVQGYGDSLEKGESSITEYAKRLQEKIEQAAKDVKGKASQKKWAPFLVILLIAVLGAAGKTVSEQKKAAREQAAIEQEMREEAAKEQEAAARGEESTDKGLEEYLIDTINQSAKTAEEAAKEAAEIAAEEAAEEGKKLLMGAAGMAVLTVGFPIFILLLVLYWLWTRRADKRCRNQLIREAGRLADASLEEWRQKGTLAAAVEESFRLTAVYMEKQYGDLLFGLLGDEKEADPQKAAFARLCSDWECIRKGEKNYGV
jgi:chemotaxis protein histidine kinase CheA